MKVTTVLTAVNNSHKYYRFVPAFVSQWKQLYPNISIRIVFIGSTLPDELLAYSEYFTLFPELEGVSSVYVAQTIRLLYPALLRVDEVTVITDMDMLPGDSVYFDAKLRSVSESAFVSLRPQSVVGTGELAMCYIAAATFTWRDVFGVRTEEDIRTFLRAGYDASTDGIHGGKGWSQDQKLLYAYAMKARQRLIVLDDTLFRRLDFHHHSYNKEIFMRKVSTGAYSDVHLYADACMWSLTDIMEMFPSKSKLQESPPIRDS